jgi:group I intron endonuclease
MSCGIYAIINKINNKKYIGKSINIENRWQQHLSHLRSPKRKKNCNRHLYNSFKKYGEINFEFVYLEVFDLDVSDDFLKEKELFWIEELKTDVREFGFNLRKDSSTKCFVSEETRQLISEQLTGENNPNFGKYWTDKQKEIASKIAKELHASGRYSSEETRNKHSESSKKFWELNPEKKEQMRKRVSEARTTYKIAQYTKEGILVKIWDTMLQILTDNPDFFRVAIYNCVNGHKKSYRGFLWKKLLKI